DQPFNMAVHLQGKPDQTEAFEAAFRPCIQATRREMGCIAYDLNRSLSEAGSYINYERWASLAALAAHLQADHTVRLLETVAPYLAASPDIRVYALAGE
ncbi:MAG TPA: antibiotic biosynthesis monooxygenase, partial [Gemmatales bacterium]|nr:antibiotic biosynthesis monooxygenase [Gemmatales bacterium]